jgi:hypothetical protein
MTEPVARLDQRDLTSAKAQLAARSKAIALSIDCYRPFKHCRTQRGRLPSNR